MHGPTQQALRFQACCADCGLTPEQLTDDARAWATETDAIHAALISGWSEYGTPHNQHEIRCPRCAVAHDNRPAVEPEDDPTRLEHLVDSSVVFRPNHSGYRRRIV